MPVGSAFRWDNDVLFVVAPSGLWQLRREIGEFWLGILTGDILLLRDNSVHVDWLNELLSAGCLLMSSSESRATDFSGGICYSELGHLPLAK